MKKLLLMFLLFSSIGLFAQEQLVYPSKYLPRPDTVWVFKPQQAKPQEKLPAVILLHGWGGNYKQWNNIMDAQKYANDYGYMIICPDGLYDSWYVNSQVEGNPQYEDFFFKELMPDLQEKLPIDSSKVFISGLSMGGHGALYLFAQQPQWFKSAGSTSGGVNLNEAFGKYGLPKVFGNADNLAKLYDEFSVLKQVEKIAAIKKSIYFDCGTDDFFYRGNVALKEKCDLLKIPASFLAQPGTHNREYWKKSIKQQFDFFKTLISE